MNATVKINAFVVFMNNSNAIQNSYIEDFNNPLKASALMLTGKTDKMLQIVYQPALEVPTMADPSIIPNYKYIAPIYLDDPKQFEVPASSSIAGHTQTIFKIKNYDGKHNVWVTGIGTHVYKTHSYNWDLDFALLDTDNLTITDQNNSSMVIMTGFDKLLKQDYGTVLKRIDATISPKQMFTLFQMIDTQNNMYLYIYETADLMQNYEFAKEYSNNTIDVSDMYTHATWPIHQVYDYYFLAHEDIVSFQGLGITDDRSVFLSSQLGLDHPLDKRLAKLIRIPGNGIINKDEPWSIQNLNMPAGDDQHNLPIMELEGIQAVSNTQFALNITYHKSTGSDLSGIFLVNWIEHKNEA